MTALTLSLARELGEHGIRIYTIAPGAMATPMMDSRSTGCLLAIARGMRADFAGIPHPARFGTPEEFADAALFPLRNPYVNGGTPRLDGGLRLDWRRAT